MTLEEKLCAYAQKRNTQVLEHSLPECGSIAVKVDEGCFIGIDPEVFRSESERAVVMAHELGHCETDSFYCTHSPMITRQRLERRASVWAIEHLIPYSRLVCAIERGICEEWELAEHFEVTREFVRAAIRYYSTGELDFSPSQRDEDESV